MNHEQRIAELQKQLNELKASLEKKEDGLWAPSKHASYYFVRSVAKVGSTYYEVADDRMRVECGNVFQTEEQAERHAKRLRLYNKQWKLAEHLNGDWVPDFSREKDYKFFLTTEKKSDIYVEGWSHYSWGIPVFKTEGLANRAISMLTDEEKEIFKNIYRP